MADVVGAAAGVIGAAVAVGSAIIDLAPTYRQCTIELKNNCTNYRLYNPRYLAHFSHLSKDDKQIFLEVHYFLLCFYN